MLNVMNIFEDNEIVLFYYCVRFKDYGEFFNKQILEQNFPFLKFLFTSEDLDKCWNSIINKRYLVEENKFYRVAKDKDVPLEELISKTNLFVMRNHKEILNSIDIKNFAILDGEMGKDNLVPILKEIKAIGGRNWWENCVKISNAYNNLGFPNNNIRNFVSVLSQFLDFKLPKEIDYDFINQKWSNERMVDIQSKIEDLTPWRDIDTIIYFIDVSHFDLENKNDFMKRQNEWRSKGIGVQIIFALGESDNFTKSLINSIADTVKIYDENLKKFILSQKPIGEIRYYVIEKIPLHLISPFVYTGPVKTNFFFGRGRIIDEILMNSETSYAIYGNRQIGKTSLLMRLKEIYEQKYNIKQDKDIHKKPSKVIYLSFEAARTINDFCIMIGSKLKLPITTNIVELGEQIKNTNIFWLLLLDELDELLTDDNQAKQILASLRSLSFEKYIRVIISGFSRLYELSLNTKSPLYNFTKPINLGGLEEAEAIELAMNPMQPLNVIYEKGDSTVKRLLHYSSYHPCRIQKICDLIICELDKEWRRIITIHDIEKVYFSQDYAGFICDSFFDPENYNPLQRLIIITHLGKTFTEMDALKTINDLCPSINNDQIEESLRNLILSFVLHRYVKFHDGQQTFDWGTGVGRNLAYTYEQFPDLIKRRMPTQHMEHYKEQLIREINEKK